MMKIRIYSMSLIVCILVAIPSSSFFLTDFLTEKITKQSHSKAQLDYALSQQNQIAFAYAWDKSELGSKRWLYLAKQLAKTDGNAAYALAKYYQKQQLISQTIAWHQRAMRLDFSKAFVSLAQFYYEQNEFENAAQVLARLSNKNGQAIVFETNTLETNALEAMPPENTAAEAIILQIKLAIRHGNISFVEQTLADSWQLVKRSKRGQTLLNDIDKYRVTSNVSTQQNKRQYIESDDYCANSIQFFATSLPHLKQVEQLILQFKQQTLAKFVCFSPVRYIAIDSLDCSMDKSKAISCNELKWQEVAETIDSRFVALLLPQGGANVHIGALYIDAEDDLDVLTHEISHLLGFVDEYPLTEKHIKCQKAQQEAFSENISILPSIYQGDRNEIRARVLSQLSWANAIKISTPILQRIKRDKPVNGKSWLLGTPQEFSQEVGVFHAQTCSKATDKDFRVENVNIAVKPSSTATKMQYFSLKLPNIYYQNFEHSKGEFVMPSFHYNIALAHIKLGNVKEGQYWLAKSLELETNAKRIDKILQGAF